MQSKEYFKNQARKLAKQTWAGPGKFGVFILLCIMIVATFESLGLSNREKNLEFRSIQKIVIPINTNQEKERALDISEAFDNNINLLNEKLKISTIFDQNRKILEREKIILNGAMEQNIFENDLPLKEEFLNLTTEQKIIKFYSHLINEKFDDSDKGDSEFFFDA